MQQNNINNLIINKMTQAQYDTITPASDELYLITDGVLQSSDVINALGYTPVNKAGDTMTGNLFVSEVSPSINLDNTALTKGSIPSENRYTEILFNDGSNDTTWANKRLAILGYTANSEGGVSLAIRTYKREAGSTVTSALIVGYDENGNAYATAPTPASTSNGTNIATTAFCDGNWTFPSSSITICSGLSINGSGYESFALSSILPNDSNLYEMILSCHGETGTASGNRVQLILSSSNTFNGVMQVFDVIARSAARVFGGGTVMFPAKSTTTLKVRKDSAYTGTVTISCLAYRKVR